MIVKLQNRGGSWISEQKQLRDLAREHFSNIFKASRDKNSIHWTDHMGVIKNILSNDSLRILNEPFSASEIREDLFQMHPSKASGPDSFTALFFQRFWHIVGTDITEKLLLMLNSGKLKDGINEITIILIPKVKQPVNLDEFRPISLSNVVSKIYSKVLANLLKVILHEVISEIRSAFILGTTISDNFLLAQELSHCFKS